MTKKRNGLYLFYELRPTHWVKNILVFLPLVFAFRLTDLAAVSRSSIAFFCFCALASAGYIFNDLIDLVSDQCHPLKKLRPLASGKVSPDRAKTLAIILLAAAFCLALLFLNASFLFVLAGYFFLQIAYVLILKKIVIIDVMALAGFYILRVVGGLAAIQAEISYWMVICIGLLALFLGFSKRRHELKILTKKATVHRTVLAHYNIYFIDQMISVITAAILMSYTLYTVDPSTAMRFGTYQLIWTTPFVYYGIFRYFYNVHCRGKGGDPVRLLLSDPAMIVNGVLWIISCVFIIYTMK